MKEERKNRMKAVENAEGPSASSSGPQATWKALDRRLPSDVIVTIDGPARAGKNVSGELLAIAMGGVLVDSGCFYRSLTQAAILAGVDLEKEAAVEAFCAGARLDAIVRPNERHVYEALATVDGALFANSSLVSVGGLTPKLAAVPLVRTLINATLRRLCSRGRVVVLGRDMGSVVFPTTRYKFFLSASPEIRAMRDSGDPTSREVAIRDRKDAAQTLVPEGAAFIDTGSLSPDQVLVTMLDEMILRSSRASTG